MAQSDGQGRPFSFHNLLKMLLSTNSSTQPAHDDAELVDDLDEPPDQHIFHATPMHTEDAITFSRPSMGDRKESLLTRALKTSPEMSPIDSHSALHDSSYNYRSYPHSNISGISTAELTSDGGMTSPSIANSPSPPLPSQMMGKAPAPMAGMKDHTPKVKVVDSNETSVEANLGRKRCISFACRPKADSNEQKAAAPPARQPSPQNVKAAPEPPTRKSTLTFVCPGRQAAISRERSPARKFTLRSKSRGSPAPFARKSSSDHAESSKQKEITAITIPKGVPTSGLGKFEESEATRFHEFASSIDEDDEWVTKSTEYPEKITLSDCMKKENAIRRLGEEAEEEAQDEEDEDDDIEDVADDGSTVHDFSSDDGNESDNEAGFADSDDSDDDGSDYEFWAPSVAVQEPSVLSIDIISPTIERRASNTSFDSMTDDHQNWLPAPVQRIPGRHSPKGLRMRPGTPNLPDSTDFVCGTLDEDRPLEAAYKSCMEQRRLEKLVLIPQDIDPSFPTSDPEDEEDLEDLSGDLDSVVLEPPRGRVEGQSRKTSPKHSPKRIVSPPPPRRAGRTSPKRLKSPPPRTRAKSPPPRVRAKSPSPEKWTLSENMPVIQSPQGLNISHLVQRPPIVRTKSLPRTPNPFFTGMQKSHRWQGIHTLAESPERERSHTREPVHTRGPVDIVEGLEKKRQKRKEKFWRQHCRKAAKEQAVRRPIPGKGAERMKELGLEVAERCRAYGVGQDAQLVLSV
ncbi:uncharacterized protein N7498_001408 [Penicillium cinerascens]|uniref:Uncharacterized protein n=1 Tax=Penicillium cinerascens TaxID=70096 RepID=A0A9W9NIJ9_9EURO|nr:uncharacterized protein N7498_001408 [Penicillium cinerascens]KAJ5219309.1 hypothetical protein N7498_001408 [Penicillium cinerascens]